MNHIIVGAVVGAIVGRLILGHIRYRRMMKSIDQLDQTNDKMRRELLRANKILTGVDNGS